jgi:TFIIF-interacting CTD phosphatase-like protein
LAITTAKTAVQLIPRPLIPVKPAQKTLVLDLDETLIHSLAKGGKLGSGHMVEVKFDKHAILYFVHKRPFCDLFLRKVAFAFDRSVDGRYRNGMIV